MCIVFNILNNMNEIANNYAVRLWDKKKKINL